MGTWGPGGGGVHVLRQLSTPSQVPSLADSCELIAASSFPRADHIKQLPARRQQSSFPRDGCPSLFRWKLPLLLCCFAFVLPRRLTLSLLVYIYTGECISRLVCIWGGRESVSCALFPLYYSSKAFLNATTSKPDTLNCITLIITPVRITLLKAV